MFSLNTVLAIFSFCKTDDFVESLLVHQKITGCLEQNITGLKFKKGKNFSGKRFRHFRNIYPEIIPQQ